MWINWKGQCTLFRGHQRCPQGSNKQIIIIIKKNKIGRASKNWETE